MTDLKSSNTTESELKSSDIHSASSTTAAEVSNGDDTTNPVAVSYPRIDSKIILQNMEEVLHTVKKQHKEKHRRKKELKKLAMIEAAAASGANGTEFEETEHITDNVEKKHKHRDKEKRNPKKRPLQEKSTVENGKVLQESPVKSGTILEHFQRTPKKDCKPSDDGDDVNDAPVQIEDDNENNDEMKTLNKPTKVTNAFEVMMNARNKTIGSNTPGKDSPSPTTDKELHGTNVKRKLKLQEWADQKGAAKRKLDDEARAAYVEEQLEQRAKRFKKMLASSGSPKSVPGVKQEKAQKARKNETKLRKTRDKDQSIEKETKRRSKPRARRLSSIDSVDSVELSKPTVDTETEEFLSKLNSPTKKRDSLLGYFPKKESPNEVASKQEVKTPKEISSPKAETCREVGGMYASVIANSSTPSSSIPANSAALSSSIPVQEIGTPSGRPRRSCAGKARYDFDLEDSPSKVVKPCAKDTPVRRTITRNHGTALKKSAVREDCDDVIVLDDSSSMGVSSGNITPQGTPKKLAPLFVRSVPKPSPDPEMLKSRKSFLQSGVPEKLRLEQEKQKQQELNYEESIEIFPKISHVKQLSESECLITTQIISCSFKLNTEEAYQRTPSPPTRRGKGKTSNKRLSGLGTLSDCVASDFQTHPRIRNAFSLDQMSLPTLANKRSIIKNWKTEFERFPTFKCYNQMREKYRYFSAIDSAQDTEQVSESFVVTRRTRRSLELQRKNKETENPDEEYKPPATAPNGELLFSEKYKPLLFEQVLVNLNPVTQLKEFLSNWSNGSGSAKNSQNFDDSMDFNDSSCSNQGPSCNTVVLLGPVSSGKTNAVFALANEMNFNVLEINAGMRRTGKKLIQELQEATQSHQIRKDAAGSGSVQKKNLLKMSLNGLKTHMMRQNSTNMDSTGSDSSNGDLSQSTRKCLILIEDADIVFEQTDAGFTDAIYTLAASSKRPVIVVASNPNCNHLQRLIAQNTIHFSSPNVLNISKFLSVLSLIENCPVLLDDIISLYLYNNRDLRRTLLELQFFIQSGGDRQKQLAKQDKPNKSGPPKDCPNYFASPRKRQFSVEQDQSDNNLPTEKKAPYDKSSEGVYMHRSLFEFYTVCQNTMSRIPFPVDFRTFGINLNEIFAVSRKLDANANRLSKENPSKAPVKRRSKSPKKQWLTNATTKATASPLDNLCSFYENLSVASMLDQEENVGNCQILSQHSASVMDRLNPNISENISHTLLEKAIDVNLDAEFCPYNLFDTPKSIISLCSELGTMQMRSKRSRNLDYEPCLRTICRSEKIRSTERRSTRFYHYLRTYAVNVCNFSTTSFDQACEVFQLSTGSEDSVNSQTTT